MQQLLQRGVKSPVTAYESCVDSDFPSRLLLWRESVSWLSQVQQATSALSEREAEVAAKAGEMERIVEANRRLEVFHPPPPSPPSQQSPPSQHPSPSLIFLNVIISSLSGRAHRGDRAARAGRGGGAGGGGEHGGDPRTGAHPGPQVNISGLVFCICCCNLTWSCGLQNDELEGGRRLLANRLAEHEAAAVKCFVL